MQAMRWGAINTSTPCLTEPWLLIQRLAVVGTWEGALENLDQQWVPLFVHYSAAGLETLLWWNAAASLSLSRQVMATDS